MDNTIRVWSNSNVDSFPSVIIRSHNACVKTVAWSPDSRFIVSGSDDKTVKVYNVSSEVRKKAASKKFTQGFFGHTNWVTTARFGPTGRMIASGGTDRTVNLWDLETGERIVEYRDHAGNINAVRFLPESNCRSFL